MATLVESVPDAAATGTPDSVDAPVPRQPIVRREASRARTQRAAPALERPRRGGGDPRAKPFPEVIKAFRSGGGRAGLQRRVKETVGP